MRRLADLRTLTLPRSRPVRSSQMYAVGPFGVHLRRTKSGTPRVPLRRSSVPARAHPASTALRPGSPPPGRSFVADVRPRSLTAYICDERSRGTGRGRPRRRRRRPARPSAVPPAVRSSQMYAGTRPARTCDERTTLEPRTPNPEPRTPNPEPRTPNPEPRAPSPEPRAPHPGPQAPHAHAARATPPRATPAPATPSPRNTRPAPPHLSRSRDPATLPFEPAATLG
ncbi:hypothetical protein HDC37_000474 [Microbacterium sp. AK009]|nr:hypothetical protein [Microbacterium sp. AK009]